MAHSRHDTAARVGILGGTFDPIHYGHLAAGEDARVALGLSEVIFVPCGDPYHKPEAHSSPAEVRFEMVRLAVSSNPHFRASRIEIERPGPSYTIDTIRSLKAQDPHTDFYLILGADAMMELPDWKRHRALLDEAKFIVVSRPGTPWDDLRRRLPEEYLRRAHLLDIPSVDVSSSEIRERVRRGLPIKYLVPPDVEQYIVQKGLYR
ncbi:MAG: nicotinate-nucleotide adenylyltransferase [Armatimonadota bacterium]